MNVMSRTVPLLLIAAVVLLITPATLAAQSGTTPLAEL